MLISVVIPTCNRSELLAQCLECLAPETQRNANLCAVLSDVLPSSDSSQARSQARYEVIVSDDSRDKGSRMMIEENYPWAQWVSGPQKGPASNRNSGARQARGEWLAFTDDDCLPSADFVSAYSHAIAAHKTVEVFEGRTEADRPRRSLAEYAPVNAAGGYLWSCNLVVRKSVFEEMGGFDEDFPAPAMEDVEFRTRLAKRGIDSCFVIGAVVRHPWQMRKGASFCRQYARSVRHFLAKHPDRRNSFAGSALLRNVLRQAVRELMFEGAKLRFRGYLRNHLLNAYSAVCVFQELRNCWVKR